MLTNEQQQAMFGCQTYALDAEVKNGLYTKVQGEHDGPLMLVMAILSDSQEVMARGDTETARQFLNRAKYIISKHAMTRREG